ncbi:hypothetical protein VTO73DRAFT_4052 [Trametes versicolor]
MRFYVATLLLAVFTSAVVAAPHALPAEAEAEVPHEELVWL